MDFRVVAALCLHSALGAALLPAAACAQDAGAPDAGESAPEGAPGPADEVEPEDPEPETTPPRLVDAPDPIYPESHDSIAIEPVVHLHVTVETDGTVGEVHVEHPGDHEFDAAAIEAVRGWRFDPARHAGEPVRSRVRLAVRFRAPRAQPPLPGEAAHADSEHDAHAHPHDDHGDDVALRRPDDAVPPQREPSPEPEPAFGAHATVDPLRDSRRPRAASDHEITRDELEAAPARDAADLLSRAPGVYVARPEGDAVAQEIFLRGFDAAHGQDIELTLNGMPLNQPSHIHGQGYADLGFIIPEVVRGLRVTEGVYDPRQGDFATAGSIDFDLGVERRGITLRTSYGSFDTFRALILWAPRGEREETFGAATYRSSSGFGANRAGQSGGALAQVVLGEGALVGRLQASIWGARQSIAGILRRDDVDAGRVGFLGVYDDPSALAQSALSARAHLGGAIEMRGARGSFTELGAYLAWSDFRLQSNYTGYTERSQVDSDWVGRGDLIEQRNEVLAIGLRGRYRSELFEPFDWARGFVEIGLQGRVDVVGQSQSLIEMPQNQTWDRRVDADIRGIDVGGYVDLDWSITDFVHLRGGVRADVLFYDVDDRLGNFIPDFRPDSYLIGYRRSAFGVAAGPRASLEVDPIPELALTLAYGQGYRSPQARQLQDGETAPYAKVHSGDLGARLQVGDHDELTMSAAGYVTTVSEDTAFDPTEGRLERLGPTTRIGGALRVVARPWSWLLGSASVTYVHATLDAAPPPRIEDPQPAYVPGQALPYVPPWVVRADVSIGERIVDIAGFPLEARLGIGFSFLSSRPLPFGAFADPVALLDAGVTVRWSALELSVEVFNLTDSRYAATEYSYSSSWDREAIPSRLPARHFAAGAPLSATVSLGVTL